MMKYRIDINRESIMLYKKEYSSSIAISEYKLLDLYICTIIKNVVTDYIGINRTLIDEANKFLFDTDGVKSVSDSFKALFDDIGKWLIKADELTILFQYNDIKIDVDKNCVIKSARSVCNNYILSELEDYRIQVNDSEILIDSSFGYLFVEVFNDILCEYDYYASAKISKSDYSGLTHILLGVNDKRYILFDGNNYEQEIKLTNCLKGYITVKCIFCFNDNTIEIDIKIAFPIVFEEDVFVFKIVNQFGGYVLTCRSTILGIEDSTIIGGIW